MLPVSKCNNAIKMSLQIVGHYRQQIPLPPPRCVPLMHADGAATSQRGSAEPPDLIWAPGAAAGISFHFKVNLGAGSGFAGQRVQ